MGKDEYYLKKSITELVFLGCKDAKRNSTKDILCNLTNEVINSEESKKVKEIASNLHEVLDQKEGIDMRTSSGRKRVYNDLRLIEKSAESMERELIDRVGYAIIDLDEAWDITKQGLIGNIMQESQPLVKKPKDLIYNFNKSNFEFVRNKNQGIAKNKVKQ